MFDLGDESFRLSSFFCGNKMGFGLRIFNPKILDSHYVTFLHFHITGSTNNL